MKSVRNNISKSESLKSNLPATKAGKENAPDIKSKSKFLNQCVTSLSKRRALKFNVMSTIRNKVQLIGNVGQEPTITVLESGKKVAKLFLATNENYKNSKGEKQTDTNWHSIVAWGKTADIIEKYVTKGKEIGVVGKLKTRTYTTEDGQQRYVTEVETNEILLLGGNNS